MGTVPPFRGRGAGSHLAQCELGRGLPPYQGHVDPSSRLGTIDTAENWGGLCRFFEEVELGPHLTQCRLGRGLSSYQMAS